MTLVVTNKRILAALLVIDTRLSAIETNLRKIMSQQDDLNTDVTALEASVAAINTAVTAVAAEIAALQAANPGVDLTGLNQAVTDLQTATSAVQGLEPPAPPAAT